MTGIPVSPELTHHIQLNRLREVDRSRLAQQARRRAHDGDSWWYVGSGRRGLMVLWVSPDRGGT
jgi:hypothetical protein